MKVYQTRVPPADQCPGSLIFPEYVSRICIYGRNPRLILASSIVPDTRGHLRRGKRFETSASRCRESLAKLSTKDSRGHILAWAGAIAKANVVKTFKGVPFSLGSGSVAPCPIGLLLQLMAVWKERSRKEMSIHRQLLTLHPSFPSFFSRNRAVTSFSWEPI